MASAPKPPQRSRPVRYWPGKAPKGAAEQASSESESEDDNALQIEFKDREIHEVTSASSAHNIPDAPAIQNDRRLMRLQQSRKEQGDGDESEPRSRRRREPVESRAPTATAAPEVTPESDEEDEDAAAERRQRMRALAMKQRHEEEKRLGAQEAAEQEEEEDQSEYTSEYTTDSEDDLVSSRTLLKPVFIAKNKRETIIEKERLEKEAEEAEAARQLAAEEKKRESHHMVAEELRREQAAAEVTTAAPDVDDTDNVNEEEEYAAWKLRELHRIKRDRSEAEEREAAKDDIERRRTMTDAEIMAEKAKDGTLSKGSRDHNGEKPKHRFMQKYFHKGAFFVDDDSVGKALEERDFAQPTLEDKFDKSVLPSVMQVKNFGRAGQTKWTHLTDQDTSNMESPWFQKTDVNKRTLSKQGGMKQGFDKPTAKRRKY
ncbi:hypothetical protein PhCBS80983_g01828 [Powellomyces hirtus]|uniref:Micro-fibrillar-associated protein 1 C-terminal domain-containing protein n=1 Tax=Powellomyces hirtus TaxID=109895 RepID=A0A507E9E6_9FUNG|nr:hypothetical protein PhCBS80983_g01828 [Powellomyces hirtus]